MRGAQEEILAGAKDDSNSILEAIRHMTRQCSDIHGLPFQELIIMDWTAIMLHILAYSMGSDETALKDPCPMCGSLVVLSLKNLPCTVVRVGNSVEASSSVVSKDEEEFFQSLDGETPSATELVLSPGESAEPFTAPPLPMTNQKVSWRYHRLRDLANAEQYAQQVGSKDTSVGSKMHSFLLGTQITHIDGEKSLTLRSIQWVRQQTMSTLNGLRDHIRSMNFGYSTSPRVRCANKECGHVFQTRMPLDGSLFRHVGGI
jgi:hypothetical protein